MGRRRSGAVALTALTGLVVAATGIVTNYASDDVPAWFADPWHVWTVLAVLVVLSTLLTIVGARRPDETVPPSAAQLAQARDLLARRVVDQWDRELRTRLLADPRPLPVRWAPALGLADPQGPTTGRDTEVRSDRVADLAALFGRLARRRLVLVGAAGTGKSTLAAQLLLTLGRERTADEPVPVLLSVAGWDVGIHPDMWDWVAERLEEDHPALRALGSGVARDLVAERMVLPILDGLDELPRPYRPRVVAAVTGSLSHDAGVVLTCRTDDYETAVADGDWLTGATVLEARPLDVRDVASYLEGCVRPASVRRWAPVLSALRDGDAPVLATVCATALGTWLVRTVHLESDAAPGRDPGALVGLDTYPDADTLERDLLGALIPALLDPDRRLALSTEPARRPEASTRRGPSSRRWRPDRAARWLGGLAAGMGTTGDEQGELRWWRLPPVGSDLVWRSALPVIGAVVGLLSGAALSYVANDVLLDLAQAAGVRAAVSAYVVVPMLAAFLLGGLVLGFGRGVVVALRARTGRASWVLGVFGALTGGVLVGRPFADVTVSVFSLALGKNPVAPLDRLQLALLGSIVLVCALAGTYLGARCARAPERTPTYVDLRLRGRVGLLARALLPGVGVGVALSAMGLYWVVRPAPAASLGDEILTVVVFGLGPLPAAVALYALAHGLAVWARTPSVLDDAVTPMSTLAKDRAYALLRASSWLAFALILAAETTMSIATTWVTYVLTIVGVVGGTACVLASTAWPAYALTVTRLAFRRRLPRRLAPFLADMNRLGVLRTVGAAYHFRHGELQRHLAATARTARSGA